MAAPTYPQSPSDLPADFTRPDARYRRHAWLAMCALAAFVLFYLALTGWLTWSAYTLISMGLDGAGNPVLCWVVGLCTAFLALFMLKALFVMKRGGAPDDLEVTAHDEPELFAFLHKLADEGGAPRPHRVFLSLDVNAAVFYDLTLLNIIFPSRKNLVIGLGLVNVLNLSELKAVLAHEFGHFTQRTMAVGRWVYITQQIAAHIVASRGLLDDFARGLSRIDIRIAWIGWILRLVVWSIRSLLETFFSWVVLAQRALSREMEFHADRVAVSLTGSDALVHALHKLQGADHAWERAKGFIEGQINRGQLPDDFFACQTRIIEHMRRILDEPDFAGTPAQADADPARHRVFTTDMAQPPQMWSTHPFNHEREERCKEDYVPGTLDERSAWTVFRDPADLRQQMSRRILARIEAEQKPQPIDTSTAITELDKNYSHEFLDSRYRGAYLGRSIVRHGRQLSELIGPRIEDPRAVLAQLYPEDLPEQLEHLSNLHKERGLLQAVHDKVFQATDGIIRFRGDEITRRELPGAIRLVEQEVEEAERRVHEHDRLCRGVHLSAAEQLGNGWGRYLQGLLGLIHFADHMAAEIEDAQGALANVFAVVTADNNVSSRELDRLVKSAEDLHKSLSIVFRARGQVVLEAAICKELEIESFKEALGDWSLPRPQRENMQDWLQAIGGWTDGTTGLLNAISNEALILLLKAERIVGDHLQSGQAIARAPEPSKAPDDYKVLLPGKERKLQTKLGLWDSFQTADGTFAMLARLTVSLGIVGSAIYIGGLAMFAR